MLNTKKGSYIAEAALIIPVFFISLFILISIIDVYRAQENIIYIASDEMRLECAETAVRKNPSALPVKLIMRTEKEEERAKYFFCTGYRYLYSKGGIDDLITADFAASFDGAGPFGLRGKNFFRRGITARAFTGTYMKSNPGDLSDEVYIFPEEGNRYHDKNCTYVVAACRMEGLNAYIRGKYRPCSLCNAKGTADGENVCYFPENGEVYHRPSCRQVKRYYIGIGRKDAESRGYLPCTKCGG